MEKCMAEENSLEPKKPLLWNPNAAVLWCLLISFIFSAFLHAANWDQLGEPDKAKASGYGHGQVLWCFYSLHCFRPLLKPNLSYRHAHLLFYYLPDGIFH